MANLMCQLDRVTGHPDVWSNITLDAPMRLLLDKMNILEAADRVKFIVQSTDI